MVRTNRYYRVLTVNKRNKGWISLQFQKRDKTWMVATYTSRHHDIQIHVDKHYKLVKFMKVHINPRTKIRAHL